MRLLLIEDESRIGSFVARGLAAEGWCTDCATDGVSGLDRALAGAYDLVVLDLLLPGLDGLSVLTELQRHRPGTPVLILSARSDLATKLRGFQLGAVDYLVKPFSLEELVARVRVQLRHHQPVDAEHVLRAAGIELDLARREVRIAGQVASLTDREFRLLRHLLDHHGEVVSRERLLSAVWGYDFDPGSNVVDVCVRRLRQKLGVEAPIETVRNVGYRLAAA